MVKRETMLKWDLKKAKKELWTIFSKYIRLRDNGVCFSCGKVIPSYYDRHGSVQPGWKASHAGHFVTAANCGLALYFHEINVNCQCYHCNINLSGNWTEYEKNLIKRYGKDKIEELKELKWRESIKYTVPGYVELIEKYNKLVEELLRRS